MTKFGKTLIIFLVIIAIVLVVYFLQKPAPQEEANMDLNEIVIENEILGNKYDLMDFSILPGSTVSGIVDINGVVQGGYFFEGNILISVLDADKNVLKGGYATATTDWMTAGPVDFEGTIDFTGLPAGNGYVEIRNDNPAGPEEGTNKFILVPIVIE